MRHPSVIFFNRVYPPGRGASGRLLRDLAHAFVQEGWRVTVVTTGPRNVQENDGAVRVIRVKAPLRNKSSFSYFRVWLKMFWCGVRLPRHDLIVTMTDPPLFMVAGQYLARWKKSRHLHWSQDVYPDLLPALGVKCSEKRMELLKGLARKALKKCDKIVVIGRCMARHMTHAGIAPGRISVVPNWPDKELAHGAVLPDEKNNGVKGRRTLKAPASARPFSEQRRNDSDPKFRVLYAGNIGRSHPIRPVLRAIEILNAEHPEIEFTFVGEGLNFDRLARERTKRGLENLRLMPFQPADQLRSVMEGGDVHLITMRNEAAGLLVPSKLYSALAVGRPVIFMGPAHGETAKIINDFKAGRVIPPDRGDLLAEAILSYRNSSETWFKAHEGAVQAGEIFVMKESLDAFIKRALDVVQQPWKGRG